MSAEQITLYAHRWWAATGTCSCGWTPNGTGNEEGDFADHLAHGVVLPLIEAEHSRGVESGYNAGRRESDSLLADLRKVKWLNAEELRFLIAKHESGGNPDSHEWLDAAMSGVSDEAVEAAATENLLLLARDAADDLAERGRKYADAKRSSMPVHLHEIGPLLAAFRVLDKGVAEAVRQERAAILKAFEDHDSDRWILDVVRARQETP